MSKGRKKLLMIGLPVVIIGLLIGGYIGYGYYQKIYGENIHLESDTYFYIPTGTSYEDLLIMLENEGIVEDIESFDWVAGQKKYTEVKPGKYKLTSALKTNNDLVNLLRSGATEPVMVTFINVRKMPQIAGKVAPYIEADSAQIADALLDPEIHARYGFKSERFITMFIPNTYEFKWNTSAEDFIQRMAEEYKKFWNEDRLQKASNLGMSQSDVSILASIVQEEQNKFPDERPMIAGVYLNRLNRDMLLQADPTLKFAWNDFSIKRVLNKHKEIDSPYNTYKYKKLPPGPICLPEISSIDAVLNYEKHDYIFMCAKDDLSGYHNFAKTNRQHEIYAQRYQRKLNELGIK